MKTTFLYLMWLCVALMFVQCTKEEHILFVPTASEPASEGISVNIESLRVPSGEATVNITVTGSTSWQANTEEDWITPTKAKKSTLQVSIQANSTDKQRTGTIILAVGEEVAPSDNTRKASSSPRTLEIAVTQTNTENENMSLSTKKLTVPREAGSSSVFVTAAVGWGVTENIDWVEVRPFEHTLKIFFEENKGPQRAATLTLEAKGASSVNFKVIQRGAVPPGLIPIHTLEQLDAMRYDLNGDGISDPEEDGTTNPVKEAAYTAQFPGLVAGNTYTGYKLMRNLDFNNNNSYSNIANKSTWTSGAGWVPVGTYIGTYTNKRPEASFNTTFDGQGHSISNLYINVNANPNDHSIMVGLFGSTRSSTHIYNLGLKAPRITSSVLGEVGALVGHLLLGTVKACYVSDGVVYAYGNAGILIGVNLQGSIMACYVKGGTIYGNNTGGLAGVNQGAHGLIRACYAAETIVSGKDGVGALVGVTIYGGKIEASYGGGRNYNYLALNLLGNITHSYYQGAPYSIPDFGIAKTSSELQAPTGYAGMYANWNVDVTGDDSADDPWHFGSSSEYPKLKVDFNGDGSTTWQEFGAQ